jgi:hypothetical protein
VQPQSIPRRIRLAALLLCAAATGFPFGADGQEPSAIDVLRPAPQFLDLFAPRLHREAYRAFVSPLRIEDLLTRFAADPQVQHPPGSWTATPTGPRDAFGEAGTYHRFRLIRLYGSTQARVARGPRSADDGQTLETWTLVSPYPDTSLTRLEPGTLILVLRVPER